MTEGFYAQKCHLSWEEEGLSAQSCPSPRVNLRLRAQGTVRYTPTSTSVHAVLTTMVGVHRGIPRVVGREYIQGGVHHLGYRGGAYREVSTT